MRSGLRVRHNFLTLIGLASPMKGFEYAALDLSSKELGCCIAREIYNFMRYTKILILKKFRFFSVFFLPVDKFDQLY